MKHRPSQGVPALNIDVLYEIYTMLDKRSLKQLSLTCKAFNRSVRPILFRRLRLKAHVNDTKHLRNLRRRVLRHVRHLNLSIEPFKRNSHRNSEGLEDQERINMYEDIWGTCVKLLPHLDSLHLRVDLEDLDDLEDPSALLTWQRSSGLSCVHPGKQSWQAKIKLALELLVDIKSHWSKHAWTALFAGFGSNFATFKTRIVYDPHYAHGTISDLSVKASQTLSNLPIDALQNLSLCSSGTSPVLGLCSNASLRELRLSDIPPEQLLQILERFSKTINDLTIDYYDGPMEISMTTIKRPRIELPNLARTVFRDYHGLSREEFLSTGRALFIAARVLEHVEAPKFCQTHISAYLMDSDESGQQTEITDLANLIRKTEGRSNVTIHWRYDDGDSKTSRIAELVQLREALQSTQGTLQVTFLREESDHYEPDYEVYLDENEPCRPFAVLHDFVQNNIHDTFVELELNVLDLPPMMEGQVNSKAKSLVFENVRRVLLHCQQWWEEPDWAEPDWEEPDTVFRYLDQALARLHLPKLEALNVVTDSKKAGRAKQASVLAKHLYEFPALKQVYLERDIGLMKPLDPLAKGLVPLATKLGIQVFYDSDRYDRESREPDSEWE